jgi:penicillin-binding protein 1C
MKKVFWLAAGCCLFLFFIFVIAVFLNTIPRSLLDLPTSLTVKAKEGEVLRVYLNPEEQYLLPVKLKNVNSAIVRSLVAIEDGRFFSHPGVDPLAVARATVQNLLAGRIESGASTITMQLARLIDPAPRTFKNKIIESLRAINLELRYSKKQILAMYLNRLPFGGNVVGVETAARIYFGKTADNLSLAEAALLAGIPRDPNRYNPLRNLKLARERQKNVLKKMYESDAIGDLEYKKARRKQIRPRRHLFPHRANHLTELIRGRGYSGSVQTTIDYKLQKSLQEQAAEHGAHLKHYGVHNLSVAIIENHTGKVRAYLGNHDFFDSKHAGQVQGPFALRSPGSALKPFLYLYAFEEGKLTPRRQLIDVASHFVGLTPENYSRRFKGQVSVEKALRQSLNIPAVRVLNRMGLDDFHGFLTELGFAHLKEESSYYGLGLILGGCGVNLMELSSAYATLARGGEYIPLTFIEDNQSRRPVDNLYSEEAAYLVHSILKDSGEDFSQTPVAYKTGTSTHHRDAWTIAYNPEYTVGVWAGNFSGEGAKELVGRRAAQPLARRIFQMLSRRGGDSWFKKPGGVGERQVCVSSGHPPGNFCSETVSDLYIKGKTESSRCETHRLIYVSEDGTESYCAACVPETGYRRKVVKRYPP